MSSAAGGAFGAGELTLDFASSAWKNFAAFLSAPTALLAVDALVTSAGEGPMRPTVLLGLKGVVVVNLGLMIV